MDPVVLRQVKQNYLVKILTNNDVFQNLLLSYLKVNESYGFINTIQAIQ